MTAFPFESLLLHKQKNLKPSTFKIKLLELHFYFSSRPSLVFQSPPYRQNTKVVKGFYLDRLEFETQLCHLLAIYLWVNYLTFVSFALAEKLEYLAHTKHFM